LTGDGTGLPERLHRLVVNGHAARDEHDAGQLPIVEAVVERLEAIQLLSNGLGHPRRPSPDDDFHIPWEEPQHPLPSKPAGERPHRGGMRVGFVRALLGRPVGKEDEGPDHFIAPLRLIHEAQLQLGKLRGRFHDHPFHWLCSRGAYVAHRMDAVTQEAATRGTAKC
jgi:hypothetical protein